MFRRIRRAFRRVVNTGKKLFRTAKSTVKGILKDPIGAARGLLAKVPLPKVVTGFAQKFLASPFAALLPGPIAGIAALLAQAKTGADILDIVRGTVRSPAVQAGPPEALRNVFELAAAEHARVFFPHIFR